MNSTTSIIEIMFNQLTLLNGFLAFFAGVLTAVFYFWNLSWTINQLSKIKKRGVFLFLSTLIRLAVFFCVLVLVADRNALKMLIFFLGFILVRIFFLKAKKKELNQKEVKHVG